MIMTSFRLTKKKLIALAAAAALVVTGGMVVKSYFADVNSVAGSNDKTVGLNAPAKTNDERLQFISRFGWEAEAEPIEVSEVVIPKEFDEVYTSYNRMQQTQGYDLSKFQNKRCKRYTYKITNYPDETQDVILNLLVYKNKVVGGDVCSVDLDGFMHGFDIAGRTSITLGDGIDQTSAVVPDSEMLLPDTMAENDLAAARENITNPATGALPQDEPTTLTTPGTVVQDPTGTTTVIPELDSRTIPNTTVPGQEITQPPVVSSPTVPETTNNSTITNPATGAGTAPFDAVG